MKYQVNLDAKKYALLLRCLSIFKNQCNDVDIRGGFIRQRTNDLAVVFEVDLTTIIGAANLPISLLKEKLNLWKRSLRGNVNISITNQYCSFSDDLTFLKTKNPLLDLLDNKFISEEQLKAAFTVHQNNLILSTEISKTTSEWIRKITKIFHVNNIQIGLNNDNASLSASTTSQEISAEFLRGAPINRRLNHSGNLIITPFCIDHDGEMKFEMFSHVTESNVVLNKFSAVIGDVTISAYSKTDLKEIVPVETSIENKSTRKKSSRKKSAGKKEKPGLIKE